MPKIRRLPHWPPLPLFNALADALPRLSRGQALVSTPVTKQAVNGKVVRDESGRLTLRKS